MVRKRSDSKLAMGLEWKGMGRQVGGGLAPKLCLPISTLACLPQRHRQQS